MNLLDYHRLRNDETRSWSREDLRRKAGGEFVHAAEGLIPEECEPWSPERLIHIKPGRWFDHCLKLCALYREANEDQQTWLRSRVDRKVAGRLHVFAFLSSVLAARQKAPDLARNAATAYAIADLESGDIRDVLIGFSLVCYCAGLAGCDVPVVFREIARISGPAMRALFEDWARRYPHVQSIGSMGWREVDTDEGVGFRM